MVGNFVGFFFVQIFDPRIIVIGWKSRNPCFFSFILLILFFLISQQTAHQKNQLKDTIEVDEPEGMFNSIIDGAFHLEFLQGTYS